MADIRPTGKKIAQVKKDLLNPATTSHFLASIGSPSSQVLKRFQTELGISFNTDKQEKLNLLCSETTLPGSAFLTQEVRNHFPGVRERHVYRREFDDRIVLTFYVDAEEYLPYRYFESWMNYISGSTVTDDEGFNIESPNFSYVMRFPNEYKGSLEITKFEKNLEFTGVGRTRPMTYKFVNMYPLAINSTTINYNASQLLKCSVAMAYSRYFITGKGARPIDESSTDITQFERDLFDAPRSLSITEIAKRNSQISGLGRPDLSTTGLPRGFSPPLNFNGVIPSGIG